MVDAGGGNGILKQDGLAVKNLILYHTEDKTLESRRKRYTEEAESVFHGRVFVPDDLEWIEL